eukprot:3741646-Lingulodinium_polyedra.AAC.1
MPSKPPPCIGGIANPETGSEDRAPSAFAAAEDRTKLHATPTGDKACANRSPPSPGQMPTCVGHCSGLRPCAR